ncbi:hypothetical protein M9Y10_010176 [Tritrichomonas musculus]|uniref:Myb-like DNA-binding domain containing protein n=1 Tax=Tritrichomonas musculus TaxID=1915356 RepID=A0ABR2IQK5_9EUKA
MISFPCLTVNNGLYQGYNFQNDANITIPVVVSIPSINYFTPYGPCFNITNPLLLNSGNQYNPFPQNLFQSDQFLSYDVPQQMKEDLMYKMMNTNTDMNNKNEIESINPNVPLVNKINSLQSIENCKNVSENNSINLNVRSEIKPDTNKKNIRSHFTKEEDQKIKELVKKFGTKNWSIVSAFMNGRTAKQCRDRYSNYLIPGIFQGEWSKEEDALLIKLFKEHGSKWSIIQNHFPKRSSNSIKNRWYYFLQKTINLENDKEEEKLIKPETVNDDKMIDNDKIYENKLLTIENVIKENESNSNENQEIGKPFELDIELLPNIDEDEWAIFN